MSSKSNTEALRTARDSLIELGDDYERAIREFEWPPLEEGFNWAHDWLDEIAIGSKAPALIVISDTHREEVSFEHMRQRSNQLARWLKQVGVSRGDVVLLMLGNQPELWYAMLAVIKIGAIILPATTALGPKEIAERVARADVRHVIANVGDASKFVDLPRDITRISVGEQEGWLDLNGLYQTASEPIERPSTSNQDPLLLYFTSGTTSRPKLVEHSQISYPIGHLTTMYWLGVRPGDLHLNISSPGWAKHAWSCFFAPWNAEATILVYNYARFDAASLLEQLRGEKVTSFCAPPTVWRMLIKSDLGDRPEQLRNLIGAGEPLNPEVIDQVRKRWGLSIRDGFGQTETSALVGNTNGQLLKPGSMGRPLPGVPVVLVDLSTGEPIEQGEGEICIDLERKPLSLMTRYRHDDFASGDAVSGRYYRTGDIAEMDEDGYITFVGRADDVFKASDYKISPFELESVLIEHPAVAEAAIVPAPDEIRLAVPKAYVTLAPGYEPSDAVAFDILKFARDHLSPFQRIRKLEFGDLPKTISGKIRRIELRARARERSPDSPEREWLDSDFAELRSPDTKAN